ncbi:MAG: hypothetical protein U5L10_05005 [Candidatus Moranbacteria bacterium]|nr:hypothetical protein [Candidatus Moranbacteria bacterium]
MVSAEIARRKPEERFNKNLRDKKPYDNDTEISKEDSFLNEKIGMDIFRVFPYHSWERE